MKRTGLLIAVAIIALSSCHQQTSKNDLDNAAVESAIKEFLGTLDLAAESNSAEAYFDHFLQTDDLVVATQGYIMTDHRAVHDTILVHFSQVEKQSIVTHEEKIDIITGDAVVVTTSKTTTITFRNGYEMSMPYALTMLIRKVNGEWKIAHYHN